MSSEKFEDLEDEFRTLFGELQYSIQSKLSKLSGEQRKRELRNVDKLAEEASLLVFQMNDEAQDAPGGYRMSLMTKTRGYKAQLDKCKRDLAKIKGSSVVNINSGRDDLLSRTADINDPHTAQRNKMIEGLEAMDRSSQSVVRSQRVVAETDEIGVGIISDLDGQRDQLVRTRDRLKQTDADLGRSRRILSSMGIRLATNKLLLVIIIILELAILAAVVYLKFFKK